jgi:hypothetical protein
MLLKCLFRIFCFIHQGIASASTEPKIKVGVASAVVVVVVLED